LLFKVTTTALRRQLQLETFSRKDASTGEIPERGEKKVQGTLLKNLGEVFWLFQPHFCPTQQTWEQVGENPPVLMAGGNPGTCETGL